MPSTLQVGSGGATTNLIQNGQFENPGVCSYSLVNVPSWTNTADSGQIEVWSQGFQGSPSSYSINGVTTATGQSIELWGNNAGTISQNVTVPANTTSLQLTFEAWLRTAGSGNYDVFDVTKGQSLIGGVKSISDNTSAWTGNTSPLITSGFSVGDTIQVRFTPLASGGGTSAASPHIDDVQLLATSAMYSTIQSAVNASQPGDVVVVSPGIYQEQVTISKSITLVAQTANVWWGWGNGWNAGGNCSGAVVIEAPTSLGTDTVANPDAIVHVTGSGVNAVVQGFTIEGASSSGTQNLLYGVRVDGGASAQINNNTITNIIDSSNSQFGVAISVGNPADSSDGLGAQVGSASIIGNTITNYQRGGIVVSNTGSSALILNNNITATSAPATATLADSVTGVEVSEGASGTVAFNAITNNYNDSDGVGVLLYQPGQATEIAFNLMQGNDYGLYGFDVTGNAGSNGHKSYGGFNCGGDWGSFCGGDFENRGVSVDANCVSHNTYQGIEFDYSTGVNISANTCNNNGAFTLYGTDGNGGIFLYQSTGNVVINNVCLNNNGSGIYLDSGSTGNTVTGNSMTGNYYELVLSGGVIVEASADAVDLSVGSGTDGTANSWTNDTTTSNSTLFTSITVNGQDNLLTKSKPTHFGFYFGF